MTARIPTLLSRRLLLSAGALALVGTGAILVSGARAGTPLAALLSRTHIHGLAVDPHDPRQLLIATHHGLHALNIETGQTVQVSDHRDDLMGFVVHPTKANTYLASGHAARGGNLGVIASTDGGEAWVKLSEGVNGPVDFHQMDISKADPAIVWGSYGGLQRSRDGGQSWEHVAETPARLIDIAASAVAPERLYAATEIGLFVSEANAQHWQPAHPAQGPVSFVEVTTDGILHAFVLGEGLVRRAEGSSEWERLHPGFEGRYLLYFTANPQAPNRFFAATQHGELITSQDGGRSWRLLGIK